MSKIALAALLVLFGIRSCFESYIPEFVVGILAWAAAAALVAELVKPPKTPT